MSISLIHQFLGESLVTLAIIGLLTAVFAKDPSGGTHRFVHIALRIFAVLLSIQWLLGVINYFQFPAAARPSLAHPLLMTAVVAAVHIASGKVKEKPAVGRALAMGVFAGAAVLMWAGMGLV